MFPVPEINYIQLLVLITSVGFFSVGARINGRSPLVWGGLSLGVWLAFTHWCVPGTGGGIISQVALFVGLTIYGVSRERPASARRKSAE